MTKRTRFVSLLSLIKPLIIVCFILFTVVSPDKSFAEKKQTKNILKYLENTKNLLGSPKKMEKKLNVIIAKISEECCEDNFEGKVRLNEIKDNMLNCLAENCHGRKVLLLQKKKPKLIVLKEIDEAEELLLANLKMQYQNELEYIQNELDSRKSTVEIAEGNYSQLKSAYEKLETDYEDLAKQNKNLKKRVETMLEDYDKRIARIQQQNDELEEKNKYLYDMLPAFKKKQADKKFAE